MSSYISLNLQSQAIANVLASDDATSVFFQEELEVLPRPQDSDSVSVATTATYKTARGSIFSLGRSFSGASTDSVDLYGTRPFTLEELCEFIRIHPSLQSAGIVSCSCYTEPTILRFIPHRFLVLELHREGRPNIWLRLDRRRAADVGIVGLSAASGVTSANDTAILASTREKLLTGRPAEESKLIFASPGHLSVLRLRLLAIIKVMNQYKLTSENCWAFCAFLLSFFRDHDKAMFQSGSLHFPKLAQRTKQQILQAPIFQPKFLGFFLRAQAVCHTAFHQQIAPVVSPHDSSLYVPFSILLHDVDPEYRRTEAAEAAHCWEDSDGFNSSDGQLLAGRLISALSWLDNTIYENPNSQLALQTTALCCQVAAYAGASWPTLGSDVCTDSVVHLYWHGWGYLDSEPPNPNAALRLFEEAASLLVPGVTRNYKVCWLHYHHALTLHALGWLDEARVVVMDFIECVRHTGRLHWWHDEMSELRSRGIWPSGFNYLLDLKQGDLPHWKDYWREDHSKFQPTLPSLPSESLPSFNPLPSTSSNASGSSPWTAPAAEDLIPSIPASSLSGGVHASAAGTGDSESNDGDVGTVHSRSQVRDAEGVDEGCFDIEVV